MAHLEGQVVIVTGASSGIGEATARRLARGGAKLVLLARRAGRVEALAREIDPAGGAAVAISGDITVAADRARLVAGAEARFGRIDALVNNAGYGTRGPVERVPVEMVRRNFETNLFSLIALTQLILPGMRARGAGRVVNVGSVAGRIARPLSSIYDSTKHALEAITDGLRGELRPFGVDVILIRPGFIRSEFVDAADRASDEALREAGPYAPYMESSRRSHRSLGSMAGEPDDIARLVERALTARRPASHYAAPLHARLFLLLRRVAPVRLVDWAVRLRK